MVSYRKSCRRETWQELESNRATGQRPVALITGAAGGIGAAFARALAARGWALALVDVDADRLHALTEELLSQGADVECETIDLVTPNGPAAAVGLALRPTGRLELVVPFAGIFLEPSVPRQSALTPLLVSINLWHPLACAELALERADALGHACVVVMPLSDAGLEYRDSWPYARAKVELRACSASLARKWRQSPRLSVFRAVVYPTHTDFGAHSDSVIASLLGSVPTEQSDHRDLVALLSTAPEPEVVVAQILDAIGAGRRGIYLDIGTRRQRVASWMRGEVLGPIVDALPDQLRTAFRVQPRYGPQERGPRAGGDVGTARQTPWRPAA